MAMALPEGEPAAGPWRVVAFESFVRTVLAAAGEPVGRPRVVAVDGRGGGGKSFLAARLVAAQPDAVVVHTDDLAWHHSFFGWDGLLRKGVLEPTHRGEVVRYRPPAWEERDRPGAVVVPEGTRLLVVEGVGAARPELADLVDAVVWVQSDHAEAFRRAMVRDVAEGTKASREEAVAFWHEWEAEELPFQRASRPWERAVLVVAGTEVRPHGPDEIVVADPPGPSS